MAIVTQAGNQIVTQGGNALAPQVAPVTVVPFEVLRQRIGLAATDNSKDVEIEVVYQMTISWLEEYLDRFLVAGTYTEQFVHKSGNNISLRGYPIVQVVSVTGDSGQDITHYHIKKSNGVMYFDSQVIAHELLVQYEMSDPLIGPLYLAVLILFDQMYASFSTAGGGAAGGGVIKAISSDGARVEFDTGSSGTSASGVDVETGVPASILGILNMFRRERC